MKLQKVAWLQCDALRKEVPELRPQMGRATRGPRSHVNEFGFSSEPHTRLSEGHDPCHLKTVTSCFVENGW